MQAEEWRPGPCSNGRQSVLEEAECGKRKTAMTARNTRLRVPWRCHMLAPKDSNLDKQIQSLSCYRYTRGQFDL